MLLVTGMAQAQPAQSTPELEQARQQLEAAARKIAELSAGAVQPAVDVVREFGAGGRRAVLGIGIEDNPDGVLVVSVSPGGGADQAGIETGDVIMAMDGAAFDGSAGGSPAELLIGQMANVDPGDAVVLTIMRDGESGDIEVEAQASRAQRFAFGRSPGGRGDGPRFAPGFPFRAPLGRWADMELVELTPGLGTYFGTDTGVLVVRAPQDSTLTLQDGDVIVEISGRAPMGVGHALRILNSFEPGEQLEFTIMRNQRRQTLEVELPTSDRGD
jgi:S1-C subfamily serine protease